MTEAELQSMIIEAARWGGWMHHHHYDSRRSTPGWPDLALIRPPQIMFLELKSEAGRVSAAQAEWIEALQACGLDARVVRPQDLDGLLAELARRPTTRR